MKYHGIGGKHDDYKNTVISDYIYDISAYITNGKCDHFGVIGSLVTLYLMTYIFKDII